MISRWAKRIFLFCLALSLLFISAFLTFLRSPELIVNSKNAEQLARFAVERWIPSSLKVEWKQLHLEIESLSFTKKKVFLQIDGLCLTVDSQHLDQHLAQHLEGCGDKLELHPVFDFTGISDFSLSPIQLLLNATRLEKAEIGNFQWKTDPSGENPPPPLSGNLSLKGASKGERGFFPFDMTLQSQVSKLPEKDAQIKTELDFSLKQDLWQVRASGDLKDWVPGIQKLALSECQLKFDPLYPISPGNTDAKVKIDCPLRLTWSDAILPSSAQKALLTGLPYQVLLKVNADLAFSQFPPKEDSQVRGPVTLKIPSIGNSYVSLKGSTETQVDGFLDHPLKEWKTDTDFYFQIEIPEFQKWVQEIEKASLESWQPEGFQLSIVPAPLHVLQGLLKLDLKGKTDLKSGEAQIGFKSRLNSKDQVVDIDGKGTVGFRKKQDQVIPTAKLDLLLSDLRLELPRMALEIPPRLFSDARITGKKVKKASQKKRPATSNQPTSSAKAPFEYEISIHTPKGGSIQILSNLAKTPIPVNLNISLKSSNPVQGYAEITQFPFELFKRSANFEQFRIRFDSPMDQSPIEAKILVEYVDYKVTIRMVGTVEKPQVLLQSDPPLPENQIVAVLLFGRPLEELDIDQSASVVNTKAAMADGAINLASLYLLASTPIQSVGYDSRTGTVSAKVRIADGTSLNLSKNQEESTIGIRKRIGKNWTLSTDYGNPPSTYLEWNHRY